MNLFFFLLENSIEIETFLLSELMSPDTLLLIVATFILVSDACCVFCKNGYSSNKPFFRSSSGRLNMLKTLNKYFGGHYSF